MVDSATSTAQPFRFLALGDAALMVEFGNSIDPDVNARVIAFAETVRAQRWNGVLDVVPTYCSVTIHVDPLVFNVETLMDRLRHISDAESPQKQSSARHQGDINGRSTPEEGKNDFRHFLPLGSLHLHGYSVRPFHAWVTRRECFSHAGIFG